MTSTTATRASRTATSPAAGTPRAGAAVLKLVAFLAAVLAALIVPATAASAGVYDADLVTGSVSGGRFVHGSLRPDASVVIWRTEAAWALVDVRIQDTASDGRNAVVYVDGRFPGGDWFRLTSAATSQGYGSTATVYNNFFWGARPAQIRFTLCVGGSCVTDTNSYYGD